MEKYLVPRKPSQETPLPISRSKRWRRSVIELTGRLEPKYRYDLSALLIQSYSEVGAFPHLSDANGGPCQTQIDQMNSHPSFPIGKQGVSSLEFDSKGIYLASVTKSGCLTVYDFETLYCRANDPLSSCLQKHENEHVLHLSMGQQLDVVCWNPTNQDEVACTSTKSNEVRVFDISYISAEPVEVLSTRKTVGVDGSKIHKCLTDVAFSTIHESRVFACDTNGMVNVWDRRMKNFPCIELTSNSRSTLNSIQLNENNQVVFGAGRHGILYMWDIRGGRGTDALQNHREVCHPPTAFWKLSSMLEKIGSLKAQSDIVSKEVHSINFDPSCPYQLAFHLDDGWSGILNIHNFEVTHVHCPPPAWLKSPIVSVDLLHVRKPSWLPTCSIYAVGSTSNNGIHLLDFYPDTSSPCHVDYSEELEKDSEVNIQNKKNGFVALSDGVTACAAHPLNGTIIAGTKKSSLLVVSQQKHSLKS